MYKEIPTRHLKSGLFWQLHTQQLTRSEAACAFDLASGSLAQ